VVVVVVVVVTVGGGKEGELEISATDPMNNTGGMNWASPQGSVCLFV